MYVVERLEELAVLCDPRVRGVLDQLGTRLISFSDAQAMLDGEVDRAVRRWGQSLISSP
jgi:hypothetical protein